MHFPCVCIAFARSSFHSCFLWYIGFEFLAFHLLNSRKNEAEAFLAITWNMLVRGLSIL
jgi:hypothetical protein